MDSLIGYGSDDDNETDRSYGNNTSGPSGAPVPGTSRRRDDDTNYDDVNMDMSEDSQAESEPELPPAESAPAHHTRHDRHGSGESRDRPRDHDRRDRRRDSPATTAPRRTEREHAEKRSPRRDDRHRSERDRNRYESSSKRGLLGDRPDERSSQRPAEDRSDSKVPALMDLKPFGGEAPPAYSKSQDARDAASPRFVERPERRERDRERERERDRHSRRYEDGRSGRRNRDRSRSRSRGPAYPASSSHASSSNERRGSPPSGDYRPSYKVNKKLEVMEKMGLQIKTPDGSMATAQQLRAAASEHPPPHSGGLPSYYNPTAVNTNKILDQVQKRKLLWGNKGKTETEEAAKWSGTRFAQDSDGKQICKFMRLMGIKEPAAVQPEPIDKTADPIKKQEELFQAMQAQYEVARATTHTMRGVGLGFQRGQY